MNSNSTNDINRIIYDKIKKAENWLGFVKSTMNDNPFFLIAPSTFINKCDWKNLLTHYNYDEIAELLNIGIVPLNRQLLIESTFVDMFEKIVPNNCEHLLLDSAYGMVIFPDNSMLKNTYLGIVGELDRYVEYNPIIKQSPSDLFSIGALRGSILLEKEKLYFEPIEIDIHSRKDLDSVISKIHNNIANFGSRWKVWFRGQTKEYRLPELSPELYKYCPWRNIRDVSLVPSLFRNSDKINENLIDYAKKLEEILMYESELTSYLGIPYYNNIKSPSINFTEYFNGTVWEDSNTPFYTTVSDKNGNFIERHDYNLVLRALQTSLFLQHYSIPTNILDVTSDIDIALFFAQNILDNGKYVSINKVEESVIYIFLLDPATDRFINSAELLQEFNVQRPIRQKCGVLVGASYSNQNYYSRFISIKLKLKNSIDYNTQYSSDYIFPQVNQDTILSFLVNCSKRREMNIVQPI